MRPTKRVIQGKSWVKHIALRVVCALVLIWITYALYRDIFPTVTWFKPVAIWSSWAVIGITAVQAPMLWYLAKTVRRSNT